MDRWMLADCQSLLRFMEEEMRGYRLYTVVPRLLQVIDNLTNWYIRFNRKRLKGVAGLGMDDTAAALNTLLQVLFTMVRALAPFIPFLTEHIYQLLRPHLASAIAEFADARSVHFLPFPAVQEVLFDKVIERQVSVLQRVIQLGTVARERRNLSLKTPLLTLVVVADRQALADTESLQSYVQEELNVRNVVVTDDEEQYNILFEARVDWPSLGKKLKRDVQVVRKALPTLTQAQLREYQRTGTMNLEGIALGEGDLILVRVIGPATGSGEGKGKDGDPQWEAAFADEMIVLLDAAPHPELVQEGLVREFINRFQRLRKKAGLVPTDEVHMRQRVISDPEGAGLGEVVAARQDMIVAALRGMIEEAVEGVVDPADVILEEEQAVGNAVVILQLARLQPCRIEGSHAREPEQTECRPNI
jgi:isoleucyl-tRNA synthetase